MPDTANPERGGGASTTRLLDLLPQQEPAELDDWDLGEPAERERFIDGMLADMPQGYDFDPDQFCITRHRDRGGPLVVCSPLQVSARIRGSEHAPARLVVNFLTDDDQLRSEIVRADDLGSNSPSAVRQLRNAGIFAPASDRELAMLLRAFRAPMREIPTVRPGWLATSVPIFRLPDGSILCRDADAGLCPPDAPPHHLDPRALEGWQAEVAPLLRGNPMPLFAVCVALAGPLMRERGRGSFGFNLAAMTSRGKSTALSVAARIWPEGRLYDWKGTRARLDDLCLAADSTFLALDEIPTSEAKQAQTTVYELFNSRRRNSREVGGAVAADRPDWVVPIFTSSEQTLAQTVLEEGVKPRHGVYARLVEFDVAFLQGDIWRTANGHPDIATAVETILTASERHCGAVGPAFVSALIHKRVALDRLLPQITAAAHHRIVQHLGIDPAMVRDETMRVIGHFTTVLVAGYVAITCKALPFTRLEIDEAVLVAAECWHKTRSGVRPVSMETAVVKLKTWLTDKARSRLAEVDENRQPVGGRRGVDGWWNADFYFLTKPVFERLADGAGTVGAFRDHLLSLGILVRGGTKLSCQVKMSSKIPGRPSAYMLDRHVLDSDGEE